MYQPKQFWGWKYMYNVLRKSDVTTLKTLFNIVEAPLKKLLNFDVCVVWWCSDGPINSQEYKSFEIYAVSIKISMTEYHHWINGLSDHLFYLQQSMGRNEYGISGHLHIFAFFEALNGEMWMAATQGCSGWLLTSTSTWWGSPTQNFMGICQKSAPR